MKSRTGLFVILGLVVILFFWGCNAYNGLIGVDQEVKTKWGAVEANYQRRTDLYNQVIKTISASANFEKSTLTEVIAARAKATSINVNLNDSASLGQYHWKIHVWISMSIMEPLLRRTQMRRCPDIL